MQNKIILGSSSPRRRELMGLIGVPFEIVVPDVEEINDEDMDPKEHVLENARLKGEAVLVKYANEMVLTADTVVMLEGRVLNKPKDMDEAREMLMNLSGKVHKVYTGIYILYRPKDVEISYCEESSVEILSLSKAAIDNYFTLVNPLDKAGAYGIQEHAELIVKGYYGHMSNIMGLPIEFLYSLFHKSGLLRRITE